VQKKCEKTRICVRSIQFFGVQNTEAVVGPKRPWNHFNFSTIT
jgi:hypothetical protein